MNKKERAILHRELVIYENMGIPLYLNGRTSTPERIEKAYQIAEEGNYMRDYIQDEDGRLKGLSFDFVQDRLSGNCIRKRKNI